MKDIIPKASTINFVQYEGRFVSMIRRLWVKLSGELVSV
jgi:hypothetical protein